MYYFNLINISSNFWEYLPNGHLAKTGVVVNNGSDIPCKFSAKTRNSYSLPSSSPLTGQLFSRQFGATLIHLLIKKIKFISNWLEIY